MQPCLSKKPNARPQSRNEFSLVLLQHFQMLPGPAGLCCSLAGADSSQQSGRQTHVGAEYSAQAAAVVDVLGNASNEYLQPRHPLHFASSSESTGECQLGSD